MSSTPNTSPVKVSTPTAPVKAPKAAKEKVVKEPKEKVVTEKKAKAEKEPKAKAEKEPKAKAEKEPKAKAEKEPKAKAEKEPSEKKPRAPTLPAKYGKFIQYSYYLIRAINNNALQTNGAVLIDEDQFIAAAHIFDNINTQQEFVNAFLENKSISKDMRAHLADKKKAEVAATKAAEKAAKEQAKNAEKLAKAEAKKAAKPPKQPKQPAAAKGNKSKNAKAKAAGENDLVTSLVALANSTSQQAPVSETATAVTATDDVEEEELDVRMFTIQGKEYLIDDNNNLYDVNSHVVIGTWDKANNSIVNL